MTSSPPHVAPAAPLALSLHGLFKTYGATPALDGVDLSIARGEVVALDEGCANGAGKSTLARIAAGAVKPDRGRIVVAGREVRLASPQTARATGIVIVHQSTDLLGAARGWTSRRREPAARPPLCGGGAGALVSRRRSAARAGAIADGIGLDIPLDADFGALGPAQRQLVAIARAVAAEAHALILEEPTASLSTAEAKRLFAVIDRLRQSGVGILYISHRLGDIRRIADQIVILRNGRRVGDQARPFDLAVAVQAMIGRNLDEVAARPSPEASGPGDPAPCPGARLTPSERTLLTSRCAPAISSP